MVEGAIETAFADHAVSSNRFDINEIGGFWIRPAIMTVGMSATCFDTAENLRQYIEAFCTARNPM